MLGQLLSVVHGGPVFRLKNRFGFLGLSVVCDMRCVCWVLCVGWCMGVVEYYAALGGGVRGSGR